MIYAGIDGIKNKMILGEPVNVTYKEDIEGLECLPQNLETAVNYAKDSDFLKNVLPENILSTYIENKKIEYDKYVKARVKEQYERDLYFGSI